MIRASFLFVASASVMILFADQTSAQIGFGATRVNGVVTGGQLQLGGFVTSGRTGVRLGVSAGASNLIGIRTFNVPRGVGNRAVANNNRRVPPSPEQFVMEAGRFDRNEDDRLDREELTYIAAAVLAELRKRPGPKKRTSASRSRRTGKSKMSEKQMIEAFVTRSMEFDTDDDDALDAAETKKMAAALIRSLG